MSSSVDTNYIIALSFFEGIGPVRYKLLKKYYGSARAIFEAHGEELVQIGLSKPLVAKFLTFKTSRNFSALAADIQKRGIHVVTEEDDNYPPALRQLKGAPFILYGLGDLSLMQCELMVAVVGTRKPTSYGSEITKNISEELVAAGCVIVSGMAMGVDAIAHKTALDRNGKTIAVLGCGVDICYPPVNYDIYKRIIRNGLVVSEFPPGMRTSRGVFPSRNRIVAGLSQAIVVTEGAEGSGALITAEFGAEYGKDVFAVPGPVTSHLSFASHYLLKNGAKVATSAADILSEYSIRAPVAINSEIQLDSQEQQIVDLIKNNNALFIDEIARSLNIPIADLSLLLSTLTIKGALQEMGFGEYTIKT